MSSKYVLGLEVNADFGKARNEVHSFAAEAAKKLNIHVGGGALTGAMPAVTAASMAAPLLSATKAASVFYEQQGRAQASAAALSKILGGMPATPMAIVSTQLSGAAKAADTLTNTLGSAPVKLSQAADQAAKLKREVAAIRAPSMFLSAPKMGPLFGLGGMGSLAKSFMGSMSMGMPLTDKTSFNFTGIDAPIKSAMTGMNNLLRGAFSLGGVFKGAFGIATGLLGGLWGGVKTLGGLLSSGFSAAWGILKGIGSTFSSILSMAGTVAKLGLWGGAGAVGGLVGGFYGAHKAMGPAAEMQGYQIMLDKLGKGGLFDYLTKASTGKPFQMGETVQAGVMMEAFGIDSKKNLGSVMDVTATFAEMGMTLEQTVRMLGYAKSGRTGEALESAARVGITREQLKATGLRFDKGGELSEGQDPEALMKAMLTFIQQRYGGMAEQKGKFSYSGAVSDLKDSVFRSFADAFKGALPYATKFVRDLGSGIMGAGTALKNLDWSRVGAAWEGLTSNIFGGAGGLDLGAMAQGALDKAEGMITWLDNVLASTTLSEGLGKVWDSAKTYMGDFVASFSGTILPALGTVWNGAKDALGTAWDDGKAKLKEVWGETKPELMALLGAFGGEFGKQLDWGVAALKSTTEWAWPKIQDAVLNGILEGGAALTRALIEGLPHLVTLTMAAIKTAGTSTLSGVTDLGKDYPRATSAALSAMQAVFPGAATALKSFGVTPDSASKDKPYYDVLLDSEKDYFNSLFQGSVEYGKRAFTSNRTTGQSEEEMAGTDTRLKLPVRPAFNGSVIEESAKALLAKMLPGRAEPVLALQSEVLREAQEKEALRRKAVAARDAARDRLDVGNLSPQEQWFKRQQFEEDNFVPPLDRKYQSVLDRESISKKIDGELQQGNAKTIGDIVGQAVVTSLGSALGKWADASSDISLAMRDIRDALNVEAPAM